MNMPQRPIVEAGGCQIYDERHFITYLRLLDAKAEGADWKEVARIVLHRDPVSDEARTRRCWESHHARNGSRVKAIGGFWNRRRPTKHNEFHAADDRCAIHQRVSAFIG